MQLYTSAIVFLLAINATNAQEMSAYFSSITNATSGRLRFVNRLSWTPSTVFELEPGEVIENAPIELQAHTWPKIASYMIYNNESAVTIMDVVFKKLLDNKRMAHITLYRPLNNKESYNFLDFTLCAEKKRVTYLKETTPADVHISLQYNGCDLSKTKIETKILHK